MISIILPTLGNREYELKRLIKSLNQQDKESFELIVVSQGNHELVSNILKEGNFDCKHIKMNSKGLSKARNEGLKYVNGNIVTLGDDDCWYPNNIFKQLENIIKKEQIQIGCFRILDLEKNEMYKNYRDEIKKSISELDIFKVSSIEIFINLDIVSIEFVKFDEKFGLGAIYKTGEENILLNDLYKKRYKISYMPITAVYHPKKESNNSFNEELSFCRGAVFKRMFGNFKGLTYINLLLIKHIRDTDNLLKCILSANKGFLQFKNI
ncbi:MAG: glycosyltransferase family 2 protein [Paraclostridium sp.]|uniref:glycosyltransferase family 2 protein n=1 Tax=Paraclostridium sp. TaxID=2023273 RepID=UPI003EE80671